MSRRSTLLPVALLAGFLFSGPAAQLGRGEIVQLSPADRKIEESLDALVWWRVHRPSIDTVIDYLKQQVGIAVRLEAPPAQVPSEPAPIDLYFQGVHLRSVLRLILKEMNLAYVVQGGALVITDLQTASHREITRLYPMADLLTTGTDADSAREELEGIAQVVECFVAPDWLEEMFDLRAVGSVRANPPDRIEVQDTYRMHEQLAEFFTELRAGIPGTPENTARAESRRKVLAALESPIELKFTKAPLQKVITYLSNSRAIGIHVWPGYSNDDCVDTERPVTIDASGTSLRAALDSLVRDLRLAYVVEDDSIVITTEEVAETTSRVRVFPVEDLVRSPGPNVPSAVIADDLRSAILSFFAPEYLWKRSLTEILRLRGRHWMIVIRCDRALEEMQGVLDGMNEVVREKRKGHAVKWGQRLNFCAKERGIAAALDSPTEGDFTDTPLDDVLRYVEKRHHITIRVDEDELKQEGLDSDCLVTANWHRISLRSALRALLKPLSLSYSVEDGALVVTPSPDLMVRQRLTLAVYVIDDLIGQRGVAEPWKAPEPFGALTPPYFAGMPTGRTDPSRRWPGPARAATLTLGGTCFLFVSSAYREQEDMAATFAKMRLAANRKARGEILPAGTEIGESDGESKDCSATRVYSIEGLVDVKEENGVRSLDAERLIRELSAAVGPVSWEPAFACYMAAYTVGGAKVLVVTQADDVHRKIARWLAERAARMPALPSP